MFPAPTSSAPIIRNEELLLLRAEANIGLNDLAAALMADRRTVAEGALLTQELGRVEAEAIGDGLVMKLGAQIDLGAVPHHLF